MWLILKRYTILEDFFLLDSVRYRDDVMTTLKLDWSNLKILMSGWYCKLTSSCVSFTIYHQCHSNIEGIVTPISLQYQNVHWDATYPMTSNFQTYLKKMLKRFYSASISIKPLEWTRYQQNLWGMVLRNWLFLWKI